MNSYLVFILAILLGTYILNLVLEYLNVSHFSNTLPNEFEGYYDEEKYATSQKYLKDTSKFEMVQQTISLIITIGFILWGGFNYVDVWARSLGFNEIVTGLIFAGILLLLGQLMSIPFSYYSTFVLEEKYGFNKTTLKTFILDYIKAFLLGGVIFSIVFTGIMWFFLKTGDWGWLYCWIGLSVFQIVLTFIAPVVIMPLFNKFIPLENGDLKNAIEAYAQEQNFTLQGIFTMDGSRRSTKANAFFTGFGRFRRIALFDTLIKDMTQDELVSVLAHEIGHYKKKHIIKQFALSILLSGLMFFILSFFINNLGLFEAFKMQEVSIYASLIFFAFLYSPINMVFAVLGHVLSRKAEFEADAFAAETYQKPLAMITALKKLSVNNLSNLTPHPWKVFLEYSHPPTLQRIRALQKFQSS